MFIGAAIVGVLTAMLTQWIRNFGKVDEGASMGRVYNAVCHRLDHHRTGRRSCGSRSRLCTVWSDRVYAARYRVVVWCRRSASRDHAVDRDVLNLLFVVICFKELKLTSFDSALADTMGLRSS